MCHSCDLRTELCSQRRHSFGSHIMLESVGILIHKQNNQENPFILHLSPSSVDASLLKKWFVCIKMLSVWPLNMLVLCGEMSWVENWLTGSSVMPGWVDNVWEEHGKKTHTSFPQLHRPHWWTSSTPAFQNQSRVSCSLLSRMGFALSKKCQTSCPVSLSADGALTACERNEGCTRSGSLNHLDCFSLPKNSNHSLTVTSAACNQLIRGRWLIG